MIKDNELFFQIIKPHLGEAQTADLDRNE